MQKKGIQFTIDFNSATVTLEEIEAAVKALEALKDSLKGVN